VRWRFRVECRYVGAPIASALWLMLVPTTSIGFRGSVTSVATYKHVSNNYGGQPKNKGFY
jgi:hypothetical protein